MSSTYWRKVAVDRLYLLAAKRYGLAHVGDGKPLVQLGRFALDLREQVAIAAAGARDVSRSVLFAACAAFLGDAHMAEVARAACGSASVCAPLG